jgi:site-specific recombinase XerD
MVESLFKQPTALARYREAPFSDAREKFLEQCAMCGYSRSTLLKIAWALLSLAHRIDIDHEKVTMRDVEQAVDSRARFKRSPKSVQESQSSRRFFVHIATEWLRSLGYLEPLPDKKTPFPAQIAAFARYLREERGLSPETISTRCERMAWFFESLHLHKESLRTISITDVNVFSLICGQPHIALNVSRETGRINISSSCRLN